MNEEIHKLYLQAWEQATQQAMEKNKVKNPQFYTIHNEFGPIFAELIVRECAKAFETEVDTWEQMDPYQGSMKRQGSKAILQHFGIE